MESVVFAVGVDNLLFAGIAESLETESLGLVVVVVVELVVPLHLARDPCSLGLCSKYPLHFLL